MDANRKKLIQLRTKVKMYKKLDKKLTQVLNGELEIEDLSSEVYHELSSLENVLDDLKIEMDLPDEEWDEDETTIASAEKKMDSVKYAVPFNVNNILAARKDVLVAKASLEEAQEKYDQINSAMSFLVEMNKELF